MSSFRARWVAIVAVLFLLAAAAGGIGCTQGNQVEASTGEDSESRSEDKAKGEDSDAARGEDGEDGKDGKGEKKTKEEAIPVDVVALERGAIRSVLRFSANLEAESEVQVFSQAKRLVKRLLVEEGDRVRRGQTLVQLEDDEQRSALAKVVSQLEKAQREFERQSRLREQELISEQAFSEAAYELDQLKISQQDAERELGYTVVRAPIDGTVTARMAQVGDQVQIGQHLFDLVDFDSMVARVYVPEKYLNELRPGLRASLSPAALSAGREYEARVDRIAPIVDPQSGTVKVTVAVGGQSGLRPGMYVNVELVTATSDDAVLIPKRALVYDNDQMFVYRLRALPDDADDSDVAQTPGDGDDPDDAEDAEGSGDAAKPRHRVERVFVEAKLTDRDWVEPLAGLAAGDEVVVAGQAGLKDGALVDLGDEAIEQAEPAESKS